MNAPCSRWRHRVIHFTVNYTDSVRLATLSIFGYP